MKKLQIALILAFILVVNSLAQAITCPIGEHSQCHSGSGRGGGYHSSCSCVPDTCTFSLQTVGIGGTIISYSVQSAMFPDMCSNYTVQSTCVALGTLVPPPQLPICNEDYPYYDD